MIAWRAHTSRSALIAASSRRFTGSGAGIAHYAPHGYRHRWISFALKQGLPIADVCQAAGQADRHVTLNTYAHVLVDD